MLVAAEKGQRELVELLLERGADLRIKTKEGKSAIELGNIKIIETLE